MLPNFAADLAPAVKSDTLSPTANPKAADAVLKKAGYTLKGGWYALKGKVVTSRSATRPTTPTTPRTTRSWFRTSRLRTSRRSFNGVSDTAWYASLANQSYGSATSHWSNSSIQMYGVYQGWLDSTLSAKGTNNAASGDFEGLKNPTLDSELRTLSAATTTKATLKAIAPIETVRREEPAGHPDRVRRVVRRIQLGGVHRLAISQQPLRRGAAATAEQRGRRAAPQAGLVADATRRSPAPGARRRSGASAPPTQISDERT